MDGTFDESATDTPARASTDSEVDHRAGHVVSWPNASSLLASVRRFLRPLAPSPVLAWSLVIASIFCVTGYFLVYRSAKPVPVLTAREVLDRAIKIQAASLEGQTEHQVLRFEEASTDGAIHQQGTIDLWRDGDGKRYMRRLYDARHRLIAAEWREGNDEQGQYPSTKDAQPSKADSDLLTDGLWKQDVSPTSFRELNGENAQIHPTEDGYELTVAEPGAAHAQIISATLVLDRHFHAVREMLRVRGERGVYEADFVEADYESRPASSVPDAIFDPKDQGLLPRMNRHASLLGGMATDVQLAELHIAVLYQLNNLHADTSEPIDVSQTLDGHVLVSGAVADDARKQEILSHLKLLNNHRLLQIRLVALSDARMRNARIPQAAAGAISNYDVGQAKVPADAVLRKYFQTQGLSGETLNAAVLGFSQQALGHAERALQNASALNRLGNTFTPAELRTVNFSSQQEWTEMVANHAAALDVELRALHEQLARLSPTPEPLPSAANANAAIDSPVQFARAANQLLLKTRNLNRSVGSAFAASPSPAVQPADIASLIAATRTEIPLQEAVDVTSFAAQLNASGRTASINRQHSRSGTQFPNQP